MLISSGANLLWAPFVFRDFQPLRVRSGLEPMPEVPVWKTAAAAPSQKFTSKGIGRQGTVPKHKISLQKEPIMPCRPVPLTCVALDSHPSPGGAPGRPLALWADITGLLARRRGGAAMPFALYCSAGLCLCLFSLCSLSFA